MKLKSNPSGDGAVRQTHRVLWLKHCSIVCAATVLASSTSAASAAKSCDRHPRFKVSTLSVSTLSVRRDTTDTMTARLATITTDTGEFTPGHRNFADYTALDLCLSAVQSTRAHSIISWADQQRRDTIYDDTTGNGVVAAVAQACGTRFTLANTPHDRYGALLDLALQTQNVQRVQALLDTLLTLAPTPDDRSTLYTTVASQWLRAGHQAAAQSLIARVDALGAQDRVAQIGLHNVLFDYYKKIWNLPAAQREAEHALALVRTLEGLSKERFWQIKGGYGQLFYVLDLQHVSDSVVDSVARQAQDDLKRFPIQPEAGGKGNDMNWGILPLDTVISELSPKWYNMMRYKNQLNAGNTDRKIGLPVPRVTADVWIPAPGHATSDTVFPVRGRINLICFNAWRMARDIRRWRDLYGSDSLVILSVDDVTGFYHERVDAPQVSGVFATFADAVNAERWHVQTYESLPIPMAVQQVQYAWTPAPDRYRWGSSAIPFQRYMPYVGDSERGRYNLAGCAIVGRQGELVFNGTDADALDVFGKDWVGVHYTYDFILGWLFHEHDDSSGTPLFTPTHSTMRSVQQSVPRAGSPSESRATP